ncbi:MAG: zinc-binding dehydrogenase [Pseudomonadota bacterium]
MSAPSGWRGAQAFGADATVDPGSNDPIGAIKALTHGRGADLTLDTSGTAAGRIAAVRSTRTWGTACFVGEGGESRSMSVPT